MQRATAALSALLLSSCGTILNGPPYMVHVTSSPAEANVYYKDQHIGRTPCIVPMDAWSMELRLTASGCHETTVEVDSHTNWAGTIGNACLLIPGVVIGIVVDMTTGAWRVPSESNVRVSLRRKADAPTGVLSNDGTSLARARNGQELRNVASHFASLASRAGVASLSDTASYTDPATIKTMRARVAQITQAKERFVEAMNSGIRQPIQEGPQRVIAWMTEVEAAAKLLLSKIESKDLDAACQMARDLDRLNDARPVIDG